MTRVVVLLLTSSILLQDPKPTRNAWAGLPAGSWVVIETTETSGEETSKKRHRFTIESQVEGKVVCQVSEETDKPAIFFEERTIEPGRGIEEGSTKAARSDPETMEIGGRKFACVTGTFYDPNGNADGKQAATVWTTKEIKVPYREWDPAELTVTPGRIVHSGGAALALDPNVLRYRMTHHASNGKMEAHAFRVVEVDHKLKVGGREIACVVEEGTIEEKTAKATTKVTFKRWLSDAVPGKVVRSEMRGEVRGVKVERRRQVVDFSPR
jgi:hypothetical protein